MTSTSIEQHVTTLLNRLTPDEKLNLLTGADMWSWQGVESKSLPKIMLTDGPHGVTCGTGDPAMSYPTGVGMASTFNTELIEALGQELGKEMHAKGYHILLGPAVDIHRAPKFGRNFECYSEDPVLAGYIGAAWVKGVQSQGIGTTPKHIAAYATTGFMDDVIVSEQALREIYLKPFEIIVREAKPTGMMTSYNQVNGHPTSEHPMLQSILKDEWGFDGFIISDWRGVLSTDAVNAGCDVEMPGPGQWLTPQQLSEAIDTGKLTWERVDDAVKRVLRFYVRMGHTGNIIYKVKGGQNTPAQQAMARRVAEESLVLLKNDNAVLPLNPSELKTLAVIGPNAASARLSGGGSAAVSPFYAVSVLEGLRNTLGQSTEIRYAEGCSFKGNMPLIDAEALLDVRVNFYSSNDCTGDSVAQDRAEQLDYAWGWVSPYDGVPKNHWSAQWEGKLNPPTDGEYNLCLTYQDGGVRFWVDDELVINNWEQTTGDFEAAYRDRSDTVSITLKQNVPINFKIQYRKLANRASLRLEWTKPSTQCPIQSAAALARASDAAVLCIGLSNQFEGGGARRVDMELPGEQNALVKAVLAANPNTVIVLIGGSPVIMEQWVECAPSIIQAWYPGVEGGNAIARTILGHVNPSGRLATTLPKRYEDTPAYGHEDAVEKIVHYSEDVFVGYRHYDKQGIAPRFGFGHGLSYTTFDVKNAVVNGNVIHFTLSNTGLMDGADVIQIYAQQDNCTKRAARSLKAFKKVFLKAGESQEVSIALPNDIDAYWCETTHTWQKQAISLQMRYADKEFALVR